jgi:aryl-alcohol dehydrogenase-like predicted oxidoreductase
METRLLGRTGERLSVVGFGGIIVMNEEPAAAARVVAQAVERGINYFDVAPSYGNAQERLGPALAPHRSSVFLACKTGKRERAAAWAELQESLRLLHTDHVDLYQLHGMTTLAEVEQVLAPDGALAAFEEAKKQGLVRYLGFSAHSEEAALALMERYPFDSVLFPLNWVTWHQGSFGPAVLAKAQEKGLGRLALKALAKRPWNEGEERRWKKTWYSPVDTFAEAELGLRFTLSLPITAAVSPGHAEFLWWACDVADRLTPLSDAEKAEVARLSTGIKPIFSAKH